MRTKFLDYDARHTPQTSRYCSMCQRDIKPNETARAIHLRVDDMMVLHPKDACGQGERLLLGADCAKKIGLEWSEPE